MEKGSSCHKLLLEVKKPFKVPYKEIENLGIMKHCWTKDIYVVEKPKAMSNYLLRKILPIESVKGFLHVNFEYQIISYVDF